MTKKQPSKRIDIVSLKLFREASTLYPARRFNTPGDAARLLEKFIGDSDRGQMVSIYLNTKHEQPYTS